ncbi:hypothetical protein B1R94_26005 [Mycolicibacterium litorale]|nr:hypothetical protein B1R94_26005 [Mycolicibacterium litorale]
MAPSPVNQQRARNAGIVTLAARDLAKLWPRVDWSSPKAPAAVTTIYRAITTRYGQAAAAVAAEFYDDVRADQRRLTSRFRATPADPVPDEQISDIVDSAFKGKVTVEVLPAEDLPADATTSDLPVEQRVQQRLENSLQRLVLQPARDTIALNAGKDPAQPRWIRVPTGKKTCAFCMMVASRELLPSGRAKFSGYKSALVRIDDETGRLHVFAENGEKFHKKCDCEAVQVYDGVDLRELSPHIDHYQDIYNKATAAAGTHRDTKKILREMRRLLNTQPEEPKTPAPEPKRDDRVNLDTPKVADKTPRPADDPLPDVRVKADLTPDPVGDLAATNPRFLEGREWQINCTRCVTAVELRARGYEVTAEPRQPDNLDATHDSILSRWLGPDGKQAGSAWHDPGGRRPGPQDQLGAGDSRNWHVLPPGKKAARTMADAAVKEWGDGARGYVTVTWARNQGAHIFNVENRGGTVVYTDGQSNLVDASGHFDRITTKPNSCFIVRTDDLTPTERVMEWVRERTDAEIGAATEPKSLEDALALSEELLRRWNNALSPEGRAFEAGAQAILDGRQPGEKYSTIANLQNATIRASAGRGAEDEWMRAPGR